MRHPHRNRSPQKPTKQHKASPPCAFHARSIQSLKQGRGGEEKHQQQQRVDHLSSAGLLPPSSVRSLRPEVPGDKVARAMDCFARDLLRGIVGEAPAPEQTTLGRQQQQQLREEKETEELDLSLGLSLGGRFGVDKGDKQPRSSSSSVVAVPTTPPVEVQVTAPPALPWPWAIGSPSFGSLGGDGPALQGGGTLNNLMSTSLLSAVTDPTGTGESNKRKEEAQSLQGLELKKRRIDNLGSSSSKEAYGPIQEDMNNLTRGLPPKHQASLSQLGESSGTTLIMEHTTSSFVPSSSSTEAIRRVMAASPLPPLSLAPLLRTTVTLGSSSRGHQTILGRAALPARANNIGDDVARRLVQKMPGVFTRGLLNANRVEGFLYKYRRAEDVRIVCICHGTFHTPSEFVEHAGAGSGKVDNPLRHIVINPHQTL